MDVGSYQESLKRYSSRWMRFTKIPWILALVVGLVTFIMGDWKTTAQIDLFSHVLLFSPMLAWSLGRRDLRGPVLPTPRATASAPHASVIYRVPVAPPDAPDARGPDDRGAWIVTGAFPWWAAVMAAPYTALTLSGHYPRSLHLDALGFALPLLWFPSVLLARILFFLWWFARVRRDASRVALLETSADGGGAAELVLRGIEDIWFASAARLDDDPLKLHLEILGSVEDWTIVGPTNLARLNDTMARVRRGQASASR